MAKTSQTLSPQIETTVRPEERSPFPSAITDCLAAIALLIAGTVDATTENLVRVTTP